METVLGAAPGLRRVGVGDPAASSGSAVKRWS